MRSARYKVDVQDRDPSKCPADQQFDWGYEVHYRNLGPDAAKAIENAANGILAAVQAGRDDTGELVAKLNAVIDGAALPEQVFYLTQVGLCAIQAKVWANAKSLIDETTKHAKKKAKL